MFVAARDGKIAELPLLLRDNPGLNVNWASEVNFLWTSLHTASCCGGVEIVEELLAHPGIDVNMKTGGGQTAVSLGSQYGRVAVVQLLLKDPRVDLTLDDHNGRTPLWWASYEGRSRVIEWLIASGRELGDIKNKKGNWVGSP